MLVTDIERVKYTNSDLLHFVYYYFLQRALKSTKMY